MMGYSYSFANIIGESYTCLSSISNEFPWERHRWTISIVIVNFNIKNAGVHEKTIK